MSVRDRLHIFRLTAEGRKLGVGSFVVDGQEYKPEGNGLVKIPHPGIPHPEAHHLVYLGYEGDGNGAFVDPDLIEVHKAIADAEALYKRAEEAVIKAEEAVKAAKDEKEKKAATEALKIAEGVLSDREAAVTSAKKKAAARV